MAAAPKIPGGTELKITSSDGAIVLDFIVPKSSALSADIKRQMVAQLTSVLPKGKTLVDEKVEKLAKDLKANAVGIEDLVERLTDILDTLKARTVPVKKAEGAAPAPAPAAASKEFKISEVQKEVAARGKAEKLFYNADAVTNAYRSESTLEAAIEKALAKMRANAPAKKAAANLKVTEAQRAAAAAKAEREAAAEEKKKADIAAAAAKILGAKSAGPASVNQGWIDTVELERTICKRKCDTVAEQKLKEGRPTRKAKTAGPVENGAGAENNTGVKLSNEEAWSMFTSGLPADIAAYVNTPTQKSKLSTSKQYGVWVDVYAGSKKEGKKSLAEYQERIKSAVGTILAKAKAAIAAVAAGTGASRKRRASGGSRKNRATRKNRKTRRRN
jgi:hypothetical protein